VLACLRADKHIIVDKPMCITVAEATLSRSGEGSFRMVTENGGRVVEENVPYKLSDWIQYYTDVADHLHRGKPVPVSGEAGRRVIAVLETAQKSAQSGRTEAVPYES
jgi:predicted dehydrogenase